MVSVDKWILRRKKIKRWVRFGGMFDRILHYGPADMVDRDIEPGQIQAGDYVHHKGQWSKVRRVSDREVVTVNGHAISFTNPGDDFLFKKPSQVGLTLFTLCLTGTIGFVSIAVSIYLALRRP